MRSGCVCAEPYGARLLGLENSPELKSLLEILNTQGTCDAVKPGFTRISLAYFTPEYEVDYIVEAVRMVRRQ